MSEKEINAIALATTPNIGFYVGVIVLAILAPRSLRSAISSSPSSPCCERAATAPATFNDIAGQGIDVRLERRAVHGRLLSPVFL